jgi:lipoprotein-anchoring transpeptidase ErfK/SrfK
MVKAFLLVLLLTAVAGAQTTAPTPPTVPASVAAIVRLGALGYWCDTSYSAKTAANRQAIYAFQKVERLPRSGKLDSATMSRLRVAHVPRCLDSIGVRHYEVNLNKQVLFMVDSLNTVIRVLPVSTGNGKWFTTEKNGGRYALTPRGSFKVYYKVSGWRKSELGELYYPLYIRGGVAIHGAPSVPPAPASHGCIRIPMFAAAQLFAWTPIGTSVLVYGENPRPTGKPIE